MRKKRMMFFISFILLISVFLIVPVYAAEKTISNSFTLRDPYSTGTISVPTGMSPVSYYFNVSSVSGHSGNDWGKIEGYNPSSKQWEEIDYRTTRNGITMSGSIVNDVYTQIKFTYYADHCMYDIATVSYSLTVRDYVIVPKSPTYSNHTENSVRATWDTNGNISGTIYTLYNVTTGKTVYTGTNNYYIETGLNTNAYYQYKVMATNPSGRTSSYSTTSGTYTAAKQPISQGFDNITENSVRLKWSSNGNPSGTIYEWNVKNTSGTIITSGSTTSTDVTATGLSRATNYKLYVRAKNHSGLVTSYTHLGDAYTISTPSNPTYSNTTDNSITISWSGNGNPSGTTYELYNVTTRQTIYNGPNTSYIQSGLNSNTQYQYKVRAKNSSNNYSEYSGTTNKYTLAKLPISDGFSNLGTSSVTLNWNHNENPSNTDYQYVVQRVSDGVWVASGWVTGTSVNATGLSPNVEYKFLVKAKNKENIENSTFTSLGQTYSHANIPTSLTLSNPTQNSMTISWNPNGNSNGTKYQLFNINSNKVVYEGTNTYYTDTGLNPDTFYQYKVRSINANDVVTTYSTTTGKDTLPSNISSDGIDSITTNSMRGKVKSTNSTNGTAYYYEIEEYNGGLVGNSGWINKIYHNFTGLSPNKKYDIYGRVKNNSGQLDRIFIGASTTLPNTPGVTSLKSSSTRLSNHLTWDTSGNPNYTVYELHVKPLNGGTYSLLYSGTNNFYNHNSSTWSGYVYKVRAKNLDGEYSPYSAEYIYTDTIKPVGQSIVINDNAQYTNNKSVNLTLLATDDLSGVEYMRFKTENGNWSNWVPYDTTYNYQMDNVYTHQGTNKVYVEFKDKAENISDPIYDTIIYDNIMPIGTLKTDKEKVTDKNIELEITASDINPTNADFISGLDKIRFREIYRETVVKDWSSWERPVYSKSWILSDGDGAKTIEMEIRDNAGNTRIVQLTIALDTLFIDRAIFTDIVNPPLNNPELPTSELVKIKRGYEFTFVVETKGFPDTATWYFNEQSGLMDTIGDNKFKKTLIIDVDAEHINNTVLPIDITVHRNSDGAEKYATLKVHVVGTAREDYDINLTN
ncbi:fibronectin type III domain-containing protein [Alkaliphilus sp. B6464]|uniref:fibronectin type III domain-containing protein n=1 Tax=Alkaliphilus sp. B6464 TaxID=2731219 RepID=UPI001BAE01F8|nr:fibronectin type III domain-containing protein [Alkaliphilus sp. B6464]QUH21979.1 fibronectin type III domain-containing protein [Alkaliphilus sp. B6464]